MRRLVARSTQFGIDLGVLAAALGLALWLRFELAPPPEMLKRAALLGPYVVALQYAALWALGVPSFSWRFIGLREVIRIFAALAASGMVLLVARAASPSLTEHTGFLRHLNLPLGVIALDVSLAFLGIAGVRITRRLVGERAAKHVTATPPSRDATLLIGAGQAGVQVAKEVLARPGLGIAPVGFLDDDPLKAGSLVHGLKVLGTTGDLERVAERTGARHALITIAGARGPRIRRIHEACVRAGIEAKIIPGMHEIVGGQVNLSRIRPVAIEDLLRREPVQLEKDSLAETLRDRKVLVTGAGGSIGSELCRQLLAFEPRHLVLVERSEPALFEIHRELLPRCESDTLVARVADVCDAERLAAIFDRFRPDVVFHAAAHKHVPLMEQNPGEAIKNNVLGTKTVADVAASYETDSFVLVSTDKAVNPTSVMGTTKRVAELYIQALSERSDTKFSAVRFGNVLGSAGSVVPIFQDQIERGGPVTVTDPEMQRYFMTIPEASQLVLQAGAMSEGGEIFILDMGEPVKIAELARDLITLSGLSPGEDIEIEYTGLRPGEKLFEELSVSGEVADKTRHPKIYIGKLRAPPMHKLSGQVGALIEAAQHGADGPTLRGRLAELVPEYQWTPPLKMAKPAAKRKPEAVLSA